MSTRVSFLKKKRVVSVDKGPVSYEKRASEDCVKDACSVSLLSPQPLYWAIQAGLLTPLTFARHHLNPLAAFTSGAYFLRKGRR